MMAKQMLWLACALVFVCHIAFAQSSSPAPSPAEKSKARKLTAAAKPPISVPAEKASPIRIPRFDKAPVIDGKLDDEVWQQAAVFKNFLQTSPGDNTEPSKPTLAMMGYDSKTLYFAFHCYDDPDKVRVTVAKRDEVFDQDNVRIFLDTFDDQRRAYILGWNPLGVQADGILTEGSGDDYSVDIVMES
jgi:hypothetical protein